MFSTPEEWYDACVLCKQGGDTQNAITMLHHLLETFPDYPLAYAALSAYYAQIGDLFRAIEHGRKYCELTPNDPFGFSILSLLYIKQGLRTEAEEALMSARDLRIAAELGKKKAENDE